MTTEVNEREQVTESLVKIIEGAVNSGIQHEVLKEVLDQFAESVKEPGAVRDAMEEIGVTVELNKFHHLGVELSSMTITAPGHLAGTEPERR